MNPDMVVLFENDHLGQIASSSLGIESPALTDLNAIIAKHLCATLNARVQEKNSMPSPSAISDALSPQGYHSRNTHATTGSSAAKRYESQSWQGL